MDLLGLASIPPVCVCVCVIPLAPRNSKRSPAPQSRRKQRLGSKQVSLHTRLVCTRTSWGRESISSHRLGNCPA